MKPVRTVLLLANDREARLLENDGVGKGLHQLSHLTAEGLAGLEPAYTSGPGRSQAAPGVARHGMEDATSSEELNRGRFAAALADEVARVIGKGGQDRLMVSAPAKMLGALRAALAKQSGVAITHDMDKDLVHVATNDLPRHFEDVAAF
ncbi:host attachment protein [Thetidibacter halocola]|uniref:Host attachment protein n=1 Tax=Thetidibacter halocola TaxID=2827239 RepID=A0A8J7WF99_9RHOB|nr:host attachment protein [Thetidibacter halocola]MBS0126580.1 host attachment protein [Thetidibacter halocola]